MMLKFAASDDLKILQAEVISECKFVKCVYAHAPYYFMLAISLNLQFDFHNELPLKKIVPNCELTLESQI